MLIVEERLSGGRNDGAVRVGQTVRRRTGEQTVAVHALLRHLEAVGFRGAPRVLGIDDQGREVLSYLPGSTVGEARPWPGWAHSDAALVAAGRWLRDFHAASASFVAPPGARWFGDHDDVRPGEVIGHHDAAPYNAVWRPVPTTSSADHGGHGGHGGHGTPPSGQEPPGEQSEHGGEGEVVGFIDWDLAGPAAPVRDLAFMALTWVPLTARDVAAADGFPVQTDRPRRLRLLLDAYGWTGTVDEVVAAVRQRAVEHADGLRAAADDGYAPAIALVAEGVADAFDRAVQELDRDSSQLL